MARSMVEEKRGYGVRGGDCRRQRGGARGGVTMANQMQFLIDIHEAGFDERKISQDEEELSSTGSSSEDMEEKSISHEGSPVAPLLRGGTLPKFGRIEHEETKLNIPKLARKKVAENLQFEITTSWEHAQRVAKEARIAARKKAKEEKKIIRLQKEEEKAQAIREKQIAACERMRENAQKMQKEARESRLKNREEQTNGRDTLIVTDVNTKADLNITRGQCDLGNHSSSLEETAFKEKRSILVTSSTQSGLGSSDRRLNGFVSSRSLLESFGDNHSGNIPPPMWASQTLERGGDSQDNIHPQVSEHSADSGDVSLYKYTWYGAATQQNAGNRIDIYDIFACKPAINDGNNDEDETKFPDLPSGSRITTTGKFERDITRDPLRRGRRGAVLAPIEQQIQKKSRLKAGGSYREFPEMGKAVLFDPEAESSGDNKERKLGISVDLGKTQEALSEHPYRPGQSEMESELLFPKPIQAPGSSQKPRNGQRRCVEIRRDPEAKKLPKSEPELTGEDHFSKVVANSRRVQYSIETLKFEVEQAKPRLDAYLDSIKAKSSQDSTDEGTAINILDMAATAPPECSLLQYEIFRDGMEHEYDKARRAQKKEHRRRHRAALAYAEDARLRKQEREAAKNLRPRMTVAEKKEEMENLRKEALRSRILRLRKQRAEDARERLRIEIEVAEQPTLREEKLEFLKLTRKGGLEPYELHELVLLTKVREHNTAKARTIAVRDFKAIVRQKYRDQAAAARRAIETEKAFEKKEKYIIPDNEFTRVFHNTFGSVKSIIKGRKIRKLRASMRDTAAIVNDTYLEGSKEIKFKYERYIDRPMRSKVIKRLRYIRGTEPDPRFAQDDLNERRTANLVGELVVGQAKKLFLGSAGYISKDKQNMEWDAAQSGDTEEEKEDETPPADRPSSPMIKSVASAFEILTLRINPEKSSNWNKLKSNLAQVAAKMTPPSSPEQKDDLPRPYPGRVQRKERSLKIEKEMSQEIREELDSESPKHSDNGSPDGFSRRSTALFEVAYGSLGSSAKNGKQSATKLKETLINQDLTSIREALETKRVKSMAAAKANWTTLTKSIHQMRSKSFSSVAESSGKQSLAVTQANFGKLRDFMGYQTNSDRLEQTRKLHGWSRIRSSIGLAAFLEHREKKYSNREVERYSSNNDPERRDYNAKQSGEVNPSVVDAETKSAEDVQEELSGVDEKNNINEMRSLSYDVNQRTEKNMQQHSEQGN